MGTSSGRILKGRKHHCGLGAAVGAGTAGRQQCSPRRTFWGGPIWIHGAAEKQHQMMHHQLSSKVFLFFLYILIKDSSFTMLISAVQQSDSVIHTYILFHILFHYGFSQAIEYNSLCYTVGPCCFSILYVRVCPPGIC